MSVKSSYYQKNIGRSGMHHQHQPIRGGKTLAAFTIQNIFFVFGWLQFPAILLSGFWTISCIGVFRCLDLRCLMFLLFFVFPEFNDECVLCPDLNRCFDSLCHRRACSLFVLSFRWGSCACLLFVRRSRSCEWLSSCWHPFDNCGRGSVLYY